MRAWWAISALVTRVEEGSPAAEAGVRPGWEVVRIGDKDVAEGIQELTQEYADNPMKRTILSAALRSRFRVPVGESVTAQFRDGQDQVVEKTMTAVTPSRPQVSLRPPSGVLCQHRSQTTRAEYRVRDLQCLYVAPVCDAEVQ